MKTSEIDQAIRESWTVRDRTGRKGRVAGRVPAQAGRQEQCDNGRPDAGPVGPETHVLVRWTAPPREITPEHIDGLVHLRSAFDNPKITALSLWLFTGFMILVAFATEGQNPWLMLGLKALAVTVLPLMALIYTIRIYTGWSDLEAEAFFQNALARILRSPMALIALAGLAAGLIFLAGDPSTQ